MTVSLPFALASRQAGVLHRRQLRAAGVSDAVTRRRVNSGQLIQIDDHVFVVPGAPPTWHQRIWIELQRSASPSVIAFRTAAQLHHVGRLATSEIDVLEAEGDKHGDRTQALHRTTRLPAWHVTSIEGIPATTISRTIFDLASLVSNARRRRGLPALTEAQVARALDDALMRGVRLAQIERVLASLAGRGRPGTQLMRELLLERSTGESVTESELEDLVLAVLDEHGVERPVRQLSVGGTEAPAGRVDFVFRPERVVLEADGRRHHTALLDAESDRWRDLELAAAGFVAVRVAHRQLVHEPARFAGSLATLLQKRRETFGSAG